MNKIHKHRAQRTVTRAFNGPVAWPENRAAHGNICRILKCRCGATRMININGNHTEHGVWIPGSQS